MHSYLTYFRDSRARLFTGLALSVGQTLPLLPIPLLLRYAFDRVIPGRSIWMLGGVGLAVIGLQCVSAVISVKARALTLEVVKRAVFEIRQALMAKRYEQPRSVYTAVEPAAFHDLLVHDIERLDLMTNAVLSSVLPAAVLMTGIGAILAWLSWPLTLTTVALLPVAAFMSHHSRRRFRIATRAFHASFERFNRATLLAIEATDLTKIEAAENSEIARQSSAMDEVRTASTEMGWRQSAALTTHATAATLIGGVILVVGGILLSRGLLTLGELMSFYAALALLRTTAGNALATIPQVVEGWDAMHRISHALDQETIPDYQGTRTPALRGKVRLERVRFGYDARAPLFRDLDLQLVPGSAVGICGESGVGKTTLAMLILGLYRPQAGQILFDADPLDELDVKGVRQQIGMLPQDPLILPGTVTENIAFGLDGSAASEDRVREAAALADAHGFITALPSGYATMLGTRGLRLSGGQRQRIALARALVRRPCILILDEPTNHLGSETVKTVLDVVALWPAPPAVLVVSHDPLLLSHIPRVFRLEGGRLAAAGEATDQPAVTVLSNGGSTR